MTDVDGSLLREGDTCWRIARADRMSIIVDAADYFRAAKQAMLMARHSVFLIGWDFDARIELEPEGQTLEGPNEVGRFLDWLGRERTALDIRILKWDLGMLRSIGRGETPVFMFNWLFGGRVRLKLDAAHPPLSSHHMKLLVIDEALVFCGGIDMTMGRWDTSDHEEGRTGRRSPRGKPLGPWHDATSCVSGPAAAGLAELARERWAAATGEVLQPLASDSHPWPGGLSVDLTDVDVGIARTGPAYGGRGQTSEIEAATLAIIASVERCLYIESQYFASRRIATAIAGRLAEPDGPEVVVVTPDTADGWLEAEAMDSARIRMMHLVREQDRHGRFRILYPVNAAGSPIYVHAKIMVADDRVLKIGSANLNNRSMGFDTECDLVLEAREDEAEKRAFITRKRNALLAEHLGQPVEAVEAALAQADGSLVRLLDGATGKGRRLIPLPTRALTTAESLLAESDLADPERPTSWRKRFTTLFTRT